MIVSKNQDSNLIGATYKQASASEENTANVMERGGRAIGAVAGRLWGNKEGTRPSAPSCSSWPLSRAPADVTVPSEGVRVNCCLGLELARAGGSEHAATVALRFNRTSVTVPTFTPQKA